MPASSTGLVLVIGEVLWDALPRGLFLGGAPLNVAAHLHTLGLAVQFASRVGDDRLGREVRRRIERRGMDTTLLQSDAEWETGYVEVDLDAHGVASYTIVEPVAWDRIAWTDALAEAAASASMVVFGSLAQRTAQTRSTITRVLEAATEATVVYDINVRPPHVDRGTVETAFQRADLAKINDDELDVLRQWYGLPDSDEAAAEALLRRFDLTTLCVTRGAHGAWLWHEGKHEVHPGYDVEVADTVGAGDAFLAMLLTELRAGCSPAESLSAANRLGAYVASQEGATPDYDRASVQAAPLRMR